MSSETKVKTKTQAASAEPAPKLVKPETSAVTDAEPSKDDKAADKKARKDKKKAKKKEKKNKEAVIIRFDNTQIPEVDARAEALGLSRAAWVRMVVAQALAKG